MKIQKRTLLASVLGAAALASAIALVSGPARNLIAAQDEVSVSEDGAFRFNLPAGDVYTYQLDFESLQLLAAPRKGGQPIGASLSLAGELRLRSYGEHDGRFRLGIALPKLERHELRFQGNDMLDPAEAERTFGEREAFIEITKRGELTTMWFDKSAPPTFRSVMETVIPILIVHAPETNQLMWSSEEPTPLGTAQTFYVAEDSDPLSARRNRAFYLGLKAFAMAPAPGHLDLHSEGMVKLAEAGHLEALDIEEVLSVREEGKDPRFSATVAAKLQKKNKTRFTPQPIAFTPGRFESVRPGELLTSEQVQKKMWEEMVGSMTLSDVELGISAYALQGLSPEDGWMTRAVLLLKMNPAYASRLSDLFQQPGMSANGRAFICDLLASAGTASAQSALRDALGSDAAHTDPIKYPGLLQRFSFVKDPTPETMAFLEAQTFAADTDHRIAANYALGAAAGHLRSGGKDHSAFNGKLVKGLKNASSAEERKMMVGALGNVGAPENIPVLLEMTGDESPEVRQAVARALRNNDAPEARDVLFELIEDVDTGVGQAALATLSEQTLAGKDVDRLETVVTSPGFNASLDQHVVTLLSKLPQDDVARVRMLEAILSRTTDARAAARVRMVRGG